MKTGTIIGGAVLLAIGGGLVIRDGLGNTDKDLEKLAEEQDKLSQRFKNASEHLERYIGFGCATWGKDNFIEMETCLYNYHLNIKSIRKFIMVLSVNQTKVFQLLKKSKKEVQDMEKTLKVLKFTYDNAVNSE